MSLWISCVVVVAGCAGVSPLPIPAAGLTAAARPATTAPAALGAPALVYPAAARGGVVTDYHGTQVADPYRWLEEADAPATRTWVDGENKLTETVLARLTVRSGIAARLTALSNHEKYGLPEQRGGRWFFTRNDGLQSQSVLYWASSLEGEPRVLLDPNSLSTDGTTALSSYAVSHDGAYLAYALATAGSDWVEWRVREVANGVDLPDALKWSKFYDAAWTHDGKGFYYARYPEPKPGEALVATNLNQTLWYHRLRTRQSDDQKIYEQADHPAWAIESAVTDDGRYLVLQIVQGSRLHNLLAVQDLRGTTAMKRAGKPVELIKAWEAEYSVLGNDGTVLYVKTNLNAPRGRIVAIDLRHAGKESWRELVPQAAEAITSASIVGGRMFLAYMIDAKSVVKVYDLQGKTTGVVNLPGIGSATGFAGDRAARQTFYSFTRFTDAPAVYRYDLASGESEVWRRPKVDFDPALYETKQVFYRSKDGTRVPMFIAHAKALPLDGDRPTLLFGYGGFGASLTPFFLPDLAVWLERGGVLAMPNLRGGGEYGEDWHLSGSKLNKQNVFDDFIAAAEWLIANRYTQAARLGIVGRSNGGLLVGACMTQRPELFGAAVVAAGVLDMLRFHRFTIGPRWVSEYGSPEDEREFAALYAYSPYHRIKEGTAYPPTLVLTGDHDDRVVPAHSFKFTAALQHAQRGPAPVLARIQTRAGHGAGKPTAMQIAESADMLAFLTAVLGDAAK